MQQGKQAGSGTEQLSVGCSVQIRLRVEWTQQRSKAERAANRKLWFGY